MSSKIEWTDETWNPVTGCTKVSQGCKNCYAERIYERFNGKGSFKNIICHQDRIDIPLRWKRPRMVFVNSMSDLFHEDVPFSFIHDVFNTISACPEHTFQILTKRPKRMLEYIRWFQRGIYDFDLGPNVWLGVSVEDQKAAMERIPFLLQAPGTIKRFLSCEPLLGPVNLKHIDADAAGHPEYCQIDCLTGKQTDMARPCHDVRKIDWVIAGGESGPSARLMHPDWVRLLRSQCRYANVPFFFKQWGEWMPVPEPLSASTGFKSTLFEGVFFSRVGKHKAGRILDGQLHDEFPKR